MRTTSHNYSEGYIAEARENLSLPAKERHLSERHQEEQIRALLASGKREDFDILKGEAEQFQQIGSSVLTTLRAAEGLARSKQVDDWIEHQLFTSTGNPRLKGVLVSGITNRINSTGPEDSWLTDKRAWDIYQRVLEAGDRESKIRAVKELDKIRYKDEFNKAVTTALKDREHDVALEALDKIHKEGWINRKPVFELVLKIADGKVKVADDTIRDSAIGVLGPVSDNPDVIKVLYPLTQKHLSPYQTAAKESLMVSGTSPKMIERAIKFLQQKDAEELLKTEA